MDCHLGVGKAVLKGLHEAGGSLLMQGKASFRGAFGKGQEDSSDAKGLYTKTHRSNNGKP